MTAESKNTHDQASKGKSSRQILSGAYGDFQWFFSQLLVFAIFFQIVSAAILGPLTAWVTATLISSTGDPVVGNTDIISFVLSPAGILTVVLGAAIFSFSQSVEQAGLMAIGAGRLLGQKLSFLGTIWLVVKKLPDLLGLSLLLTVIYIVAAVPFLGIAGLVYKGLLSEFNINYYLAYTPPVFWVAVAIAAVLLLGLGLVFAYLYLRWIFSVPAIVFEGRRFYTALSRSHALMKGNFRRSAVVVFSWAIFIVVLGAVALLILQELSGVVLGAIGDHLSVMIGVSAILLVLHAVVLIAISFVGSSMSSLLIIQLYFERYTEEGLALPTLPEAKLQDAAISSEKRASTRWLIWIGAILLLLLTGLMSLAMIESLDIESDVSVTAHRGYSLRAPENSLSAIELAAEAHADLAEIDVQETADGVIVVIHDDDLMRVAGVDKKIWEVTYNEIKDLDAGSWFSPEFKGEKIPTLEEAIDVSRGKIKLMVELKYNGHDQKLAERTVGILEDNDFISHSVIHSLNYQGLMETKKLNPNLEVGYVAGAALGDVSAIDTDFLSLATSVATADVIDSSQENGKAVAVWTVNDRDDMITMINRGADNLITDDPALAIVVIEEMSQLSDVERLLLSFKDQMMD